MGLRKPTAQEFLIVGIVGLIVAAVQVVLNQVFWGGCLAVIAVGMFWRAWRAGRSSQGAA
jgi:hypothetical protein